MQQPLLLSGPIQSLGVNPSLLFPASPDKQPVCSPYRFYPPNTFRLQLPPSASFCHLNPCSGFLVSPLSSGPSVTAYPSHSSQGTSRKTTKMATIFCSDSTRAFHPREECESHNDLEYPAGPGFSLLISQPLASTAGLSYARAHIEALDLLFSVLRSCDVPHDSEPGVLSHPPCYLQQSIPSSNPASCAS